jgi:hypothetical protein
MTTTGAPNGHCLSARATANILGLLWEQSSSPEGVDSELRPPLRLGSFLLSLGRVVRCRDTAERGGGGGAIARRRRSGYPVRAASRRRPPLLGQVLLGAVEAAAVHCDLPDGQQRGRLFEKLPGQAWQLLTPLVTAGVYYAVVAAGVDLRHRRELRWTFRCEAALELTFAAAAADRLPCTARGRRSGEVPVELRGVH